MAPRLANSAAMSLPGLNMPQAIPLCVDSVWVWRRFLTAILCIFTGCSLAQFEFDRLFHEVVLGNKTFCLGSLWFGEDSLLQTCASLLSSSV